MTQPNTLCEGRFPSYPAQVETLVVCGTELTSVTV